jgi:hypothetical protein
MPIKIFTIPGAPQKNEIKLYYNENEATGLLISVMLTPQRTVAVFEFTTRCEDGTELDTSNGPVSGLFAEMDWRKVQRFPGQMDLGKLHQAHLNSVEQMKQKGVAPRHQAVDNLMEEIRKSQVRQMEFQVGKGILRKDEKANVYRATPKIALRGVSKYINPFADDFTIMKFVMGVVLGLGITLLWVFAVDRFSLESALRDYFVGYAPAQITFLAYVPGFILAGLVLGWQFPQKGFIWGFIISIPGVFLLPATATNPLVYSVVAAMAGFTANKLRGPAPVGEKVARFTAALAFLIILIVFYFLRVK